MGADATLVAAAYRMGMANVPGDYSASFNKQYEGIIATNQAMADMMGEASKVIGDVGGQMVGAYRERKEETIKRIEKIESDIENIKAILREILDALEKTGM